MDFSFPEADDKNAGGGIKANILNNPTTTTATGNIIDDKHQQEIQGHSDHSPKKLIDISDDGEKLSQHHKSDGSGSTDDFEHVYNDESLLSGSIGKPMPNPTSTAAKTATAGGEDSGVAGMMEEFLGTTKASFNDFKSDAMNTFENSASNLMHNVESNLDKINKTIDFMNAERGGGGSSGVMQSSSTAKPIPVQSDNSAYSDAFTSLQNPSSFESDYQKEHYNPSPIKKSLKKEDDEKFISSEDLLGDFKDERMSTPEHKPSSLADTKIESSTTIKSAASNVELQQKQPHSGIEDLTIDNDSISATVKENISKIPGLGEKPKPQKVDETSTTPKKPIETIGIVPTEKGNEQPASSKQMISAEEIFYKFGLDTWFKPESLHPRVESLIYWRDVKKSGIVFGAGLIILLAISCFSVISVFAYLSLIALSSAILFRIYKTVMGAVQKTSEGHPFKEYLEMDLNLSQEKVQQIVNASVAHVNGFVSELRRLFLVEDLVDSIKFGVILWILTYIGAWFNGMTLVIMAFVSLFTIPKLYENNKQSIDTYLDLVRTKILEITDKVKAAIPIGKKPETDKDK